MKKNALVRSYHLTSLYVAWQPMAYVQYIGVGGVVFMAVIIIMIPILSVCIMRKKKKRWGSTMVRPLNTCMHSSKAGPKKSLIDVLMDHALYTLKAFCTILWCLADDHCIRAFYLLRSSPMLLTILLP